MPRREPWEWDDLPPKPEQAVQLRRAIARVTNNQWAPTPIGARTLPFGEFLLPDGSWESMTMPDYLATIGWAA